MSSQSPAQTYAPAKPAGQFDLYGVLQRFRLWLFLAPPLIALIALLIVPLVILLQYSFFTHVPGKGMLFVFTLDNYVKFFTDGYYLMGILITLGTGALNSVITLLVCYPVAYYYARSRSRHKGLILVLLLAPFYVNIIVKIYGWMIILGRTGMVNQFLIASNIMARPYDFLESYIGIIVVMLHVQAPIMVLSLIGPLQNIHDSLIDTARVCGARDRTIFKDVVLPLSMPGILSGSMLVFAATVAAFIVPLVVGGRIGFQFLSVMVYQQMNTVQNWAFGAAIAVVLLVLSIGVVTLYSVVLKASKVGVIMSEKFIR
ncbi:MAG: ABC transporter permease [Chloroflexi bacterium]|nr:ABC transporter permease [Chloroflexota bacterium]